jgi:hypothetical protein
MINAALLCALYGCLRTLSQRSAAMSMAGALATYLAFLSGRLYIDNLIYSIWPALFLCVTLDALYVIDRTRSTPLKLAVLVANVVLAVSHPLAAVVSGAFLAAHLLVRAVPNDDREPVLLFGASFVTAVAYLLATGSTSMVRHPDVGAFLTDLPDLVRLTSKQLGFDLFRLDPSLRSHVAMATVTSVLMAASAVSVLRGSAIHRRIAVALLLIVLGLTSVFFASSRFSGLHERMMRDVGEGPRYFDIQRGVLVFLATAAILNVRGALVRFTAISGLLAAVWLTHGSMLRPLRQQSADSAAYLLALQRIASEGSGSEATLTGYWGPRSTSLKDCESSPTPDRR